ncbi:MAG: LON peptidase substrate-binding domain-containing protein [Pseudomonadota bacterium]
MPLFPLSGAILFPRGTLPLNVFEPRYLNMIDDAMSGSRLIGMIQPRADAHDDDPPPLSDVGCVGRITSYSETEDGRYLIILTGVSRFKLLEEADVQLPYRMAEADFHAFGDDLKASPAHETCDRASLLDALRAYLDKRDLNADWSAVSDAPMETLINALAAGCPFSNAEKQALLEAEALRDRCDALVALLNMGATGDEGWMQ